MREPGGCRALSFYDMAAIQMKTELSHDAPLLIHNYL